MTWWLLLYNRTCWDDGKIVIAVFIICEKYLYFKIVRMISRMICFHVMFKDKEVEIDIDKIKCMHRRGRAGQ